jgi:branched-chain amino acid transport system permease protein
LADLVRLVHAHLHHRACAAAALVAGLRSLPITIAAGLGIGVIEACGAAYPAVSDYRGILPYALVIALLMWSHRSRTVAIVAKDGR